MPILAICEADDSARLMRGLEIGVNDYLMRPIDKNELHARVRTQIRKKRYTERLRDNVQMSIEMAITDALTGLYNRRYMESHLSSLVEQAAARGKPLTALVIDIDYFKSINDSHGHDAGDDVLREFAAAHHASRSAASTSPAATAARSSSSSCRKPTWRSPRWLPSGCAGASPPSRSRSRRARSTIEVTISIGLATLDSRRRQRRHDPQARRPGALSRQARRPQPGRRRRGVTAWREPLQAYLKPR